MRQKLPNGEFDAFESSLQEKPPVSVRINPVKGANLFEDAEKVPWCSYGRYLKERPAFVWDPLYHAGAYYAQEASSMLFANAIDFSKDLKVLDLCAAPGGKSSLLLSYLSENSLLVSNELVGKRAAILYENLVKWGGVNTIITNNRTSDFAIFKGYFDVVMIDAPCSGEGMFRKDREAVEQWNDNLVRSCSNVQKELMAEAVELVKPGGLLIYSTCTFEEEENERNIRWLYSRFNGRLQPHSIPIKKEWGVTEVEIEAVGNNMQYGYYCYPHKLKGEGQFIAAMIVTEGPNFKNQTKSPSKSIRLVTDNELNTISPYLDQKDYLSYKVRNEDLAFAFPQFLYRELGQFIDRLYIRKAGTLLGKIIRNSFVPDHEMAMDNLASRQLGRIDLSLEEALNYMQRKNVDIKVDMPNGWFLFKIGRAHV